MLSAPSIDAQAGLLFAVWRKGIGIAMKRKWKYEVIIYWSDEDQAYIAEVPELPGCAADGPTYRQVLANVEVVIQEWIDTARELKRSIPESKRESLYT